MVKLFSISLAALTAIVLSMAAYSAFVSTSMPSV